MALTLSSRVVQSEGLRRVLQISLRGNREELAGVDSVLYDLGPTFAQRYWRVDLEGDRDGGGTVGPGAPIEIVAYGDFSVFARVRSGDEQVELAHAVVLRDETAADTSSGPSDSIWTWAASASARAAIGTQLGLAAQALVLAALLVAAWPDGSDAMGGFGVSLRVSRDTRLLLVAAAAGGLGALAQVTRSWAMYIGNRNVYPSWIGWHLLRAPTGMALGVLLYLVLRIGLIEPTAAAAISPIGLLVLAGLAGVFWPEATTKLQDIWTSLFGAKLLPLGSAAIDARDADLSRDTSAATRSRTGAEMQHKADIAAAEAALRGRDAPSQELYELAERLRKVNEFGYARRLYGRLWQTAGAPGLKATLVKVGQQHALCTYKDADLPAGDRFRRALEILDAVDRLDFAAPSAARAATGGQRSDSLAVEQRQESLGLRGAVYKRRWQIEAQREDLDRALGCYLKGYETGRQFEGNRLGVETDYGYTGINAAFVLDLIAREDARQSALSGIDPVVARQRCGQARAIRDHLSRSLPQLLEQDGYSWLRTLWWFHATLAEAHMGLGRPEQAVSALRVFNTAHELSHQGPPLGIVPRWEFESTLTQLIAVAQLQAELAPLGESSSAQAPGTPAGGVQMQDHARQALRDYLGPLAPALDRADVGKLGLALSGGGFRASLYHIGVLAYLAERDALRRVEVLSCVSGGSIVGAHFYLEVQHLLETKGDADITRDDYLAIVARLERDFVAGVQSNIRAQAFGSVWANLRAFLQPGYTTTRYLGALYERELYARVDDGRHTRPRHLPDLLVRPKDEPQTFAPKYDNWRRHAKVPTLVLNATTLNTGHNWQFTASWMGEPPIALDAEIEGNYVLRRMYHEEAPRQKDRWTRWYARPFAPPDYRRIRLGEAVAASSCVPGLFEPVVMPDLYPGKVVRLVDGGVHDNQGVASLLEQDCTVMIVSDASGQMETVDDPKPGRLGVSLRSFSVSMTRVRQAQFRELAARTRSGLLKGLVFLHLKRDLDVDPVDWRDCQDPHDASDQARPVARRGVLTQYGVQKSVQRLLSGIRTDLDSFSDVEAFALMTGGYRQAQAQFARLGGWPTQAECAPPWRFLEVEPLLNPGPDFEEASRLLQVGSQTALKIWRLSRGLQVMAAVLAVAAAYGMFRLWQAYRDVSLLTVGGLASLLLVTAATVAAPRIVAIVRYQQTIRSIGVRSAIATVLALAFKVHLLFFDAMFLKRGSMQRFRQPRS